MDRRRYLQMATGAIGGMAGIGTAAADGGRPAQTEQITANQRTKLSALDAGAVDKFGFSLALNGENATGGERILVGAPGYDGPEDDANSSGAVYVFEPQDGSLAQQTRFGADDGDSFDNFGRSVALDGDRALVGAVDDEDPNGPSSGSAYVFEAGFASTWSQETKLAPSDGDDDDKFGDAVALDGETALVGAPGDEDPTGSAYIFRKVSGSWTRDIKLVPDDTDAGGFGEAVAVDGQRALIGARFTDAGSTDDTGAAYLYERINGVWTRQATLTGSGGERSRFGEAVALDGDRALVGAGGDDNLNGNGAGSAFVFERSGGDWAAQTRLVADDGDDGDSFGKSAALSGDTALIGAWSDEDPNGRNGGSAYVFQRSEGSWSQQSKLSASDGDSTDLFGASAALADSTAVVGAFNDDDPNRNKAGSAYVFDLAGSGGLPTADPSFQEVLAVIEAFNDGERYNGVDVSFQDVLAVIEAFNDS